MDKTTKTEAADSFLARRVKLMKARDAAIKAGDWNLMNEICRRLAKLPVPAAK